MTTVQHIRELLRSLPRKADDIAQFFAIQGVTGDRMSACGCPLASWLARELTGLIVSVENNGAYACHGDGHFSVPQPLPPHVIEFVANHDAGKYPFLMPRTGA